MLKAAVRFVGCVKYEGVVVIRNLAHHRGFRLNNPLHVAPHTLHVIVALAVNHYAMRNTSHLERNDFEPADLNGRIIKYVEVLGAKGVGLALDGWKPRCNSPITKGNDAQD